MIADDNISNAGGYGLDNKFLDLLDAQIFRVINNKVFEEEAEHMIALAKLENANAIVDFGCWVGVLANEVLKRWPDTSYHLVDAVPLYISKAKAMLMRDDIPTTEVTLIPDNYKGDPPTTMLVHPYDTLNSSSIYSKHFLGEQVKAANVTVPVAPVKKVSEFVRSNKDLFETNNYIKIDLDGVDMDLVNAIIDAGYQPSVIHFEVWNAFKPAYDKLKERLSKLGYVFPDMNLKIYQHFSISVSKHHWWAVGYENVTVSPTSHYHKSW
jgi:hypothetical protein